MSSPADIGATRHLFASPTGAVRGVALALVLLTALPVFAEGFEEIGRSWMTAAYSHGPAVVLISAWLFLRDLRDEPEALRTRAPGISKLGLTFALLGLAAGTIGTLAEIGDIAAYGLILWLGGALGLALGTGRARRLWLPVALLVLSLPLPQVLYWQLTTSLLQVSSEIAVILIGAMGISVHLSGNVIDLGVYRLQVAEACAGLQYLIPVLSFGALFAVLLRGPVWQRLLLVLIAAPLAVAMNALRIAAVAWAVDRWGTTAAEGVLHAFEGWGVLLLCLLILAALPLAFRALRPASGTGPLYDLDVGGLSAAASRLRAVPSGRGLLVLGLAGSMAALALLALPHSSVEAPRRESFAAFPRELAGWIGHEARLDPEVAAVLAADDYLDITYVAEAGTAPVNLFAAYYDDQRSGTGLHSPAVCLPADGWEVTDFGTTTFDGGVAGYGLFKVNRAVVTRGTERQLVRYWFEQRGSRTTNDFLAKIDVLMDSVTRGRKDGAVVRFVTPITPETGGIAAAEHRLDIAMRGALQEMPRFIPF